ncbi:MAG: nicotinate-nucleotide adenylyltransferase [Caldilineaceae bacterium]|nr:nicotinate-nucleotide adenylyltransferase [Caldilineaceae bacterium]
MAGNAIPRLGVFGGTFDPVHVGHLLLAQEAALRLSLDQTWFVPANYPPHKAGEVQTPFTDRLAMVELAVAGNPAFSVSLLNADDAVPNYTADLMEMLQTQLAGRANLYFLMGMDSLRDLHTWHKPDWLVQNCELVILNRPGVEKIWLRLDERFPGIRNRVHLMEMPGVDLSGTNIRTRIDAGEPIRYLVPLAVHDYIEDHSLYVPEMGDPGS